MTANTFNDQSEAFPSKIITPDLITCPSVAMGFPTYRTIMIRSEFELPATFKFENESNSNNETSCNYEVYPPIGIIGSQDAFQLVTLRSVASSNDNIGKITAKFNDDTRYS